MNEHEALERAIRVARDGPCQKSRRGVVVWHGNTAFFGWNHPPKPFVCDGSAECKAACGKVCVHAEAHAILATTKGNPDPWFLDGAEMLHVKVVDGKAVPSGEPSCWQCSRLILEAGISGMWLLHEEGLRRYTAEEFHQLTLEHCGFPSPMSG